jgi:starvation-inducible DNA-binding protein
MNINIGISENKRIETAKGLSHLLADSYSLYLKTHNYHWNVTGPMFTTFHELFENQYTELASSVDEIAERIRILGVRAPGSYKEFSELTKIKEDVTIPGAQEMIQNLLTGHEEIVNTSKAILPILEGGNDEGTLAIVGSRIEYHEKTAWVLRSMLS